MLRRSQLFVPGNDERKIKKSLETLDCDSIVLDLEDAVPPDSKSLARTAILNLLSDISIDSKRKRKEICIRINAIDSAYAEKDIEAFRNHERVNALIVPKAESREKLSELFKLTEISLIPLIETARGFIHIEEIAQARGVIALGYGAADFANSLGGSVREYMENGYVKTKIAVMAKGYGIDPIDNVFFDLSDLQGFRKQAQVARDLGFTGKQVIHPSQIAPANETFSPSKEEISNALEIVNSYEEALLHGIGAIRLRNELVDAVHYKRAKEILDKVKEIENARGVG